VIDHPDPIEVGGRTTYTIDVTNQGSLPGNQVQITAYVPNEMRIINARGPTSPRIQGNTITFPGIDSVQPKQTVEYIVEAEAIRAGDVRFRVELRSQTLGNVPVVEEESTNIYDAGARPAPPASGTQPTPAPGRVGPPPPSPGPVGSPPPPGTSATGTRLTPMPTATPSPVIATSGVQPAPVTVTTATTPSSAGYVIPASVPSPTPTSNSTGPAILPQ